MRIPLFLLAVAVIGFTGCAARKPKSTSRIYRGDGPTITYTHSESAGGTLEER